MQQDGQKIIESRARKLDYDIGEFNKDTGFASEIQAVANAFSQDPMLQQRFNNIQALIELEKRKEINSDSSPVDSVEDLLASCTASEIYVANTASTDDTSFGLKDASFYLTYANMGSYTFAVQFADGSSLWTNPKEARSVLVTKSGEVIETVVR